MKNFKAFFRWLYVEILKLSDKTICEELSKVSQQDIQFIGEFLQRFAPINTDKDEDDQCNVHHHMYLEKVNFKIRYFALLKNDG